MNQSRTKNVVLEQEFLTLRAKILEIAAGLDRLDRASGSLGDDGRRERLNQALAVLLKAEPGRAERVQLLFSRPFVESWRADLGV